MKRPFLKPIFSIVYCRLIFPELGEHLKYLYIYQIWYIIHKMYRCKCIFIYSELFVGQTENVVHISEAFLKIRIFFFVSSKIKFILILLFIHRNLNSFRKFFLQANDILHVMKILFVLLLCFLYFDKKILKGIFPFLSYFQFFFLFSNDNFWSKSCCEIYVVRSLHFITPFYKLFYNSPSPLV